MEIRNGMGVLLGGHSQVGAYQEQLELPNDFEVVVDEPPCSVCSEFVDLPIHHPISSKRHHYNPHTLHNTASTR